jgi:glycosyltransferase involved in cell wall biosynthesis
VHSMHQPCSNRNNCEYESKPQTWTGTFTKLSMNNKPSNKMKILLVVPWDQAVGGVASVVGHLGRHLQGGGHEVVFLNPGQANFLHKKKTKWGFTGFDLALRSPYHPNRPVRNLLAFLGFFPLVMFQLLRLIRKYRINIINIHYPSDCFIYFAVCRWLLPIKLVISVHGSDLFPSGRRLHAYPRAFRLLLKSSDAIVAPSRAFAKDFISLFPGLARRVHSIHNGVDIEELGRRNGKGIHGSPERYLLCVAANNEKKALDVLIRAFALLAADERSLNLILVGDGPLRARHEALTARLNLGARVLFFGEKGRAEVVSLLQGCELLVLPSRAEPFGIVIPEAMACRKPVVASAVGGIPEIIADGSHGVLVEPDNPYALAQAISDLLKDPALQKTIADRGYRRVLECFRFEHTGAKYEQLFLELAAAGDCHEVLSH